MMKLPVWTRLDVNKGTCVDGKGKRGEGRGRGGEDEEEGEAGLRSYKK